MPGLGLSLGHGLRLGGGVAVLNRGLTLAAEATAQGVTLAADLLAPAFQSWDNDPASAVRRGRWRAGGRFLALQARSFASLFAFTRASGATDFDAAGLLQEVAADALRAGNLQGGSTPAGWLLEQGTTNRVTNPRGEGAVVGVIGSGGAMPTAWSLTANAGLTVELVSTGVEHGLPYVDMRWQGTPTSTGGQSVQTSNVIALTVGDNISVSCWVKLVAGTLTNTSQLQIRPGGETGGVLFTPTGTLTRYVQSKASLGSNGQVTVRWNHVDTVTPVDFTLRFAAPQSEASLVPTSLVLPTVGTPAQSTRAADVLTMPAATFASVFGGGAQGFLIADVLMDSAQTTSRMIAQLDDGSSANRIELRPSTSLTANVVAVPFVGNAQQANASIGGVVYGATTRVGLRWGAGVVSACANGGTVHAQATTLPALTTLRLGGGFGGGAPLNGRLRAVYGGSILPSDAKFQAACVAGADVNAILWS